MAPCGRREVVSMGATALAAALLHGCAAIVTRRVPVTDGRVEVSLLQHPDLDEAGGALRLLPDGWIDAIYVLRLDDGSFAALSPVCTHLGCTVELSGARLVCPCHGSTYERSGRVVQGPAQRDLRRFGTTRTRDGLLVIHVGSLP
jgi:Rieske Fe-S protein